MTNEVHLDYHAIDAVSASRLEDFLMSPRLYQALYVDKTVKPGPPTDKLELGIGCHAWLLEPDKFEQLVALVPNEVLGKGGRRNTKAYREFAAQHQGKALLKLDDSPHHGSMGWQTVKNIRRAVMAHPIAETLIRCATSFEEPFFWECLWTGLSCKAKPDLETSYKGRKLIVDLKTTGNSEHRAFVGNLMRYGYHRQAEFYRRAMQHKHRNHNKRLADFVFVVVSTVPPHVVRVYSLPDEVLNLATDQITAGMERLAACYKTGDWSEPNENEICELQLPKWAWEEARND